MKSPILIHMLLAVSALRPSTAAGINPAFIIEIIGKLNEVYPLKTLPIFWSRFVASTTNSIFLDFAPQLARAYPIPQMHITKSSREELRFLLDVNTTLSIVFADHMSHVEILKFVSSRLRGMHSAKLLLVFKESATLLRLRYFLNWLWKEQFRNSLVLFHDADSNQNQIFTIDAYPTLQWVNKTDVSDPSKLFMGDSNDLKQYPVEILYMEDVPRVFNLKKSDERRVVGRHANIIELFAKHLNFEITFNFQPHLDEEKLLREFKYQSMELSVNSYSMFDLEESGSSYPLETVSWCIMVPLRSEIPRSEYVIISFDRDTWIASGLSVVYIAVLLRFIDPPTPGTATQNYFFLRSLAMLMYSPNMAERMTMPTVRQFVFFAQVFLLGFILSCIYSTYLTSFCTNLVFQAPIDSVEDLVKENLRVMVIDYELEAIRSRATYDESFFKLLYPASYAEVNHRRAEFDKDYAYTIRRDRWNFLNKQQRGLQKPFFRLSNICFGSHFIMFPLQFDSHFRSHLNMFILTVMQAGLDVFWDEEVFRMAVSRRLSKVMVEKRVAVQPLRLDYFKHVYAGYWSLIGISTFVFAVEFVQGRYFSVRKALEKMRRLEGNLQNRRIRE